MEKSDKEAARNRKRRQNDQARLESWKAIANYFNRSVRTVRRWETVEGMPVHRHRHSKGASVYAYCSELDQWRLGHREAFPDTGAFVAGISKQSQARRWGRNAAIVVVAAFFGGIVARYVPIDTGVQDAGPLSGPTPSTVSVSVQVEEDIAALVSAWGEGRLHDVLRESESLRQRLPGYSRQEQSTVAAHLVEIALSMGRIGDARAVAATVTDDGRRAELDVNILFAMGDKEKMRSRLEQDADFGQDSTPLFMSMAGLTAAAIDLNAGLESGAARSRQAEVILAIAEMRAGRPERAKPLLQAASAELLVTDRSYYFVALDILARIYQAEGKLAHAINTLEGTLVRSSAAASNGSGLFWLMCQRQLAVFYREAGRESDAARLENSLRDWLVLADTEFPLAQSLAGA